MLMEFLLDLRLCALRPGSLPRHPGRHCNRRSRCWGSLAGFAGFRARRADCSELFFHDVEYGHRCDSCKEG